MTPEESGEWLIQQLADEALLDGQPLSSDEIEFLRTSIWDLHESQGPIGLQLNNRLVPLARQRIERAKASGSPTKKVRPGLVIPTDWNSHYIRVHNSELPWFVSGVMQNAILGNALAGRRSVGRVRRREHRCMGGSACLLVALGSAIAVPLRSN